MVNVTSMEFEKHTSKLGIFLPFCHFEREMEKNIELANGIGLGCREAILSEMKVLENDFEKE